MKDDPHTLNKSSPDNAMVDFGRQIVKLADEAKSSHFFMTLLCLAVRRSGWSIVDAKKLLQLSLGGKPWKRSKADQIEGPKKILAKGLTGSRGGGKCNNGRLGNRKVATTVTLKELRKTSQPTSTPSSGIKIKGVSAPGRKKAARTPTPH